MKPAVRSLVRYALGAFALALVSLFAASPAALAQAAASATAGPPLSRLDLYGGYSYFRPQNSDINNYQYQTITAGSVGSVGYFFTPHFGIQAEANITPEGPNDQECNYSAQAGPIYRIERGRFVPFVHVLGGGAMIGGPANQRCGIWGFGVTGGLGFDYLLPVLHGHLAVRPLQLDFNYAQINNGPTSPATPLTGGLGQVYAFRYTGGLVFRLGSIGEAGAHIGTGLSCSADPSQIFSGDPVVLTATAANLRSKRPLRYLWSSNGGRITGSEATAQLDSTGLAPGEYTVSGRLVEADRATELASCTTTFTVQAPAPPTLRCSADRAAINSGDVVSITSVASSAQGRPLTYTFSTSNGTITGAGATATLATTGATPGTITITCQVADDRGGSATATTSVVVATPKPAQAAAAAQTSCDLSFERDRRRPTRVDNEAKGCLDDLALQLNRDTNAHVLLNGTYTRAETKNAGEERALNAAQYLEREKGVDSSRVELRISAGETRAVHTAILAAGAAPDADPNAAAAAIFDPATVQRHGEAYGTAAGAPGASTYHRKRRHHHTAAPQNAPAPPQ